MSFESFLTYDAPTPTKKKKQPSRPPQPPAPLPSASSSKSSKANGTSSKRSKPSSSSSSVTTPAVPEKRKKVWLNLFFWQGNGEPAFVQCAEGLISTKSFLRLWMWFPHFLISLCQPFSPSTDHCPPLTSRHSPPRDAKVHV